VRRVISILGSLFLGLVVTIAGVALDVQGLIYAGFAILALMCCLWLYSWASPETAPASELLQATNLFDAVPPANLDEDGRALWSIRAARAKAVFAQTRKGAKHREQAYREVRAALLTAEKRFGIPPLKFKNLEWIAYSLALEQYVAYIDRFYPLLAEGHAAEAKHAAVNSCVITYSVD
jgi:hypothetical protein